MGKDKKRDADDDADKQSDQDTTVIKKPNTDVLDAALEDKPTDGVALPKFTFSTPSFTFKKCKQDVCTCQRTAIGEPKPSDKKAPIHFPQWNFTEKPKEFNPLEAVGLPASALESEVEGPKPTLTEAQKSLFDATWGTVNVCIPCILIILDCCDARRQQEAHC